MIKMILVLFDFDSEDLLSKSFGFDSMGWLFIIDSVGWVLDIDSVVVLVTVVVQFVIDSVRLSSKSFLKLTSEKLYWSIILLYNIYI